jgi:hypothetical protein
LFLKRDHDAVWKEWQARCNTIAGALAQFEDVRSEVQVPSGANAVPHLHVTWNYEKRRLNPAQMAAKLRDSEPGIEVVPGARRELVVGVWMMEPGDEAVVAQRMKQILAGA